MLGLREAHLAVNGIAAISVQDSLGTHFFARYSIDADDVDGERGFVVKLTKDIDICSTDRESLSAKNARQPWAETYPVKVKETVGWMGPELAVHIPPVVSRHPA